MFDSDDNVVSFFQGAPLRIVEKFERGLRGEKVPVSDRRQFRAYMSETWRPHLTPEQWVFLLHIEDRSISIGENCVVDYPEFILHGNDTWPGAGLADMPAIAAMASLEELGVIDSFGIEGNDDLLGLAINLTWSPEVD